MPRRTRYILYSVILGLVLVYVATVAWGRWSDSDAAESPDEPVRAGLEEFLDPWYDAMDNASEEPATVVVVGDSISEGVLLPAPMYQNRFTGLLQSRLREAAGVAPGSIGYMPAYYGDRLTRDDTVRAGPPIQEQMFKDWGLGGRAALMPGGATLTYPAQKATRVRVWYGRTALFGGQGRVYIDGLDVTAQGTLSTGGSSALLSSADTKNVSGLWWTSPELDSEEHVVRIANAVPNTFFVHTGVEFFDGDDDSGVRVVDGSHSGVAARDFASPEAQRGHWNEVAQLDPQLIVVNLGTNAEPDYPGSLRTLVEHALAAAPRARILLVDGYEPGKWDSEAWQEIRDARKDVAAQHPDRVAVFDLAAHWPKLAKDGSTSEGLMLEQTMPVHPNVPGHLRMAEIFAELLTPAED